MIFEWDETKNRYNRDRHGLDFDAVFAFDWENALIADRTRHDEGDKGLQRWACTLERYIRSFLQNAAVISGS